MQAALNHNRATAEINENPKMPLHLEICVQEPDPEILIDSIPSSGVGHHLLAKDSSS